MASVEEVRALIIENSIVLKRELDAERDQYARQNANTIRSELNALFLSAFKAWLRKWLRSTSLSLITSTA